MVMGTLSRYWIWFGIDSLGHCQSREIPAAKTFMKQHFSQATPAETPVSSSSEWTPRQIQQQLVQWRGEAERALLANMSLRCFISNQLKDFCYSLQQRFGSAHDLQGEELLPYVLDPHLEEDAHPRSESLTSKILESFEPSKGNLSTWTIRIAKSDIRVKQILLEHGIEQVTDWLILNQTSVGQLQRILSSLNWTPTEIEHNLNLLNLYHQVYRQQILEERQKGSRKRYPEPSQEQLSQMATTLPGTDAGDPEQVLTQLQNLAQILREDRIQRKTQPHQYSKQNSYPHDSTPTSSQELNSALADAVKAVIENRLIYYQPKKKTPKAQEKARVKIENFIRALHWFHCHGMSMKEIAERLGFNDQPRVTRLLELKELRSDIRRNTVCCLCDQITQLAQQKQEINSEQLQNLSAKVEEALGEKIDQAIAEDRKTASTGTAYRQPGQLSKTICRYLKTAVFHIDNQSLKIDQLIQEDCKC
jgi:flagellar biosynthesis chaperone FliJ/predicted XRE-type DNA-binding protein